MRVDMVNHQDVGMIEGSGSTSLLFTAMQSVGIGRETCRQHPDRHVTPQTCVARTINLPHPARAEGRDDFVWPKSCSSGDGHGRIFMGVGGCSKQRRYSILVG